MISTDRLEEMFLEAWLQARMFSGTVTTYREFEKVAMDFENSSFECKITIDTGRPSKEERERMLENMRKRFERRMKPSKTEMGA